MNDTQIDKSIKKTVDVAVSMVKALDSVGIALVPAIFKSQPDWVAFYTFDEPRDVAAALVRLRFLKKPEFYEFEGQLGTGEMMPVMTDIHQIAFPLRSIYVPKVWIVQ